MKKVLAVIVVLFAVLVFVAVMFTRSDECENTSSSAGLSGSVPEGSFAKPESIPPGTITSGFGARWGTQHEGLDISTGQGTPIHAYADGVVTAAGPASGFGQWIRIKHTINGEDFETLYGHMYPQDVLVTVGQSVKAGQVIAREGSNGQSTGSHLHFEVHPGGYRNPVDPQVWVDKAVNASGDSVSDNAAAPDNSLNAEATKTTISGDLPPLPASVGSEAHWTVNSVRLARAVHAQFPEIKTIGGWRPVDAYPDHPSGWAIDIMIPNWQTEDGISLGSRIQNWVLANSSEFKVKYIIWRQTYYPGNANEGVANLMEDRGSPTQNHMDHVHVTTYPAPLANGDEAYSADGIKDADGSTMSASGCSSEDFGDSGEELAPGHVPAEFEPWLRRGAAECAAVDAPLLAAQLQAESGFRKGATSGAGAQGYAQFMPGTWKTWGYKVDENGNKISAAGEGDPNSVGDAVMAQARFMCALADEMEGYKAAGKVTGDTTELMLAGYNAGSGAVLSYHGIPPYAETQGYVQKIMTNRKSFAL